MNVLTDVRRFLHVKDAGLLLSILIFYGIGTGILAPMNSIYLRDSIGLTKGQIVSVFSVSLLLNMGITIMAGAWSDKLAGKKKLALTAAVLCMTGLSLYMRADNYLEALVGMCIAVAPSGLIMGQLFAMSRLHFQRHAPEIVEMAQIWLRAGYSVGFFLGLLAGANIYLLANFQGVLWGNLAGYALLFGLLLFFKEYKEKANPGETKAGEPFSLLMLFALLMLACADAIRGLYLPLVVKELFGKPHYMSYLWSAQAVFELLFMTVAGYWAARYGSKRVILLGALCALATYFVYSSSPSLAVFFIMQPVYSFFVSVLYGVAMGYVQRMFLSRSGFGASLYVFISQTASLIGYLLPLFAEGYRQTIFLIPSSLVAGSLLLMTLVLMLDRKKDTQMAKHQGFR